MEKVDKIGQFLSLGLGSGSGLGLGSGSGSGSGLGSGLGEGLGSGSGEGLGSGWGEGWGEGSGIQSYNGKIVYVVDNIRTIIDSVHGSYAKGSILNSNLTLTSCYIAKRGNYFAHGKTLAEAVRDAESKYTKNLPTEERIRLFVEAHPVANPETRYAATNLYEWHHTLTGSCEFGRKEFARDHNIDIDSATFTVEEFIKLTENAYGGDIIKQLKQHYYDAKH